MFSSSQWCHFGGEHVSDFEKPQASAPSPVERTFSRVQIINTSTVVLSESIQNRYDFSISKVDWRERTPVDETVINALIKTTGAKHTQGSSSTSDKTLDISPTPTEGRFPQADQNHNVSRFLRSHLFRVLHRVGTSER